MMRSHLLLAAWGAVAAVSGAYIQTQDCAGGYTNRGMKAFIRGYEAGHMQLQLDIADNVERNDQCETEQHEKNATANLKLLTLGSAHVYDAISSNYTCEGGVWGYYEFDLNVAQPHLIDTYLLSVELRNSDDELLGCIDAHLTPALPGPFVRAITWAPICIFALIVLVALWRETANLSLDSSEDLGPSTRDTSHGHVTRVADYLSYLQFIFFSAALSLHYPGFLQPVASRTSWSTLMFPAGMVQRKSWYPGVADGIYETNGTMTGSAGLEVVTQVVGGAVTFDNWLNIVSLATLIFFALFVLVYLGVKLTWSRDWFRSTHSLSFRHGGDQQADLTAILWTAVRLFCAYLLVPLVAWTTYQLVHVGNIPIYYSVAASAVVCALVLLVWWATFYGDPRNMGYLLVDDSKNHGNASSSSRMRSYYSTGVYVMLFLRGIAHGSLELHGTAQLFILLGSEVCQLALQAIILRTTPFSSRSGAMPLLRLAILALQSAFLPHVAAHGPRMAVGYVILAIHAVVIMVLFFTPAVLDLGALARGVCLSGVNTEAHEYGGGRPQVYGLRQLRQRPTNPSSPRLPALDEQSDVMHGQFSASLPRLASPTSYRAGSPLSDADQQSFFRPPRTPSAMLPSRLSSSTWQPATSSESSRSSDGRHIIGSRASPSLIRSSSSGDDSSGTHGGESSESRCEPSPLDPNVDYSVREADQYYTNPRKLSFGQAQPEGKRKALDKMWFIWSKR
ncbi:uncharacterized protein F5Z01DRAFT_640299 [Emericellopsis atlantica]|uniref:TRP C-terminal domain-containing protein n=1 Tax=Emericellopsis atlantica TaxID=2614577 RepID=A0A9P7ZDZ8_9HYPO|nr:uncharacterized protein F5Z01DRAFT_640299 [Emericellopsis atlantica]KAG9250403.1 hypothetical protein F5Z01DRAFT_640299 [Emericellopsis atlantica]